jgi:sulfite dehydrogenase (quinone) subunit SoeC
VAIAVSVPFQFGADANEQMRRLLPLRTSCVTSAARVCQQRYLNAMHPAYSVIFFTTASGAGYGLLLWLATSALLGGISSNATLGFVGMGLALSLIAGGLLSSTLHLGRPERAWRAFSQWRTSWLSREGVAALATFVPAGILALVWIFGDAAGSSLFSLMAAASIVCAAVTVYATGMIYQSLPTVRAWNEPLVTPIYLALAVASGAVLAFAVLGLFGEDRTVIGWCAVVALCIAAIMKRLYWQRIDSASRTWTAENATGLGRFGKVKVLEQPHSTANFVMREMGFQVGRRHAEKLRNVVMLLAFAVPALLILLALMSGPVLAGFGAIAAVISMAIGLLTERWLFFAEAQHVVTTFYGAERA